jgi:tetratricopeptide (TPR) repeat protein
MSGSSLYNLGMYTESLSAFEKAIEIKPENSYSWYDRGNAFYHLGDCDLAVHDFAKGESLNSREINLRMQTSTAEL